MNSRKELDKYMAEDLILKWAGWGWTPEKILASGGANLANYDTVDKIRKFLKKNFSK